MEMSIVRHQVLSMQWQQRILQQHASGLSVRRWCAEQNIRESRYCYWLQILRNEELATRTPAKIFGPLVAGSETFRYSVTVTSLTIAQICRALIHLSWSCYKIGLSNIH